MIGVGKMLEGCGKVWEDVAEVYYGDGMYLSTEGILHLP